MERITIIGVGPIGASIGRGLMARGLRETEVVISSRNRRVLKDVAKIGAADKTIANLRSAVSGARLVILDVSSAEMRELLERTADASDLAKSSGSGDCDPGLASSVLGCR